MKRLLLFPFALLAIWLYLRLQKKPAEVRLKVVRTWVNRGLFLWQGGRKRIEKNIGILFPEMSEQQVQESARDVAHTVGANAAYALGAWHETIEDVDHRIVVGEGLEEVRQRLEKGDKVIVVVDHVAPFDGAAAVVEILNIEAGIIVEKLPWLMGTFFNKARLSWKGISLIPAEKGSTYQRANSFLQTHNLVAVFVDIFRRPERADVTTNFGQLRVGVSSLPIRLAFENQADVYTMLPLWVNGNIYLDAQLFDLNRKGDLKEDIVRETQRLVSERIEPHIKAHINHWMRAFSDDLSKFKQES